MSMITATAWVPRGHAVAFPTKYVFDEDEYARISKLAKLELDDAKDDLENAKENLIQSSGQSTQAPARAGVDASLDIKGKEDSKSPEAGHEDSLREYDLEHYDDEPDTAKIDENAAGPGDGIFGNIKGLAYYTDNKDDPYITLPENGAESDEEEREEMQILPTDNLILATRIEDEVAHLETYIYEDDVSNLYVHHDVMLPAVPLCVEWVNARPGKAGKRGNFAAVGTMDPDIELWDLDVVDGIYPTAILGQTALAVSGPPAELAKQKKQSKKKKKSKQVNNSYHVDAVLSLASNRAHNNLLASASADKTVKLWDLDTCTAAQSYSHHTDKVCALSWHPTQTSVLLTGSYDRTIVAADMRSPSNTTAPRWGVESDVEQVRWDPHSEHMFYVSTENGLLHAFDARQRPLDPSQGRAVWHLQAHSKPLSTFSLNPAVPNFLATASTDRTTKLWNLSSSASGGGPSMLTSRDLEVGKVFSVAFGPDPEVAFRLAVAGSKGAVQIWDTSTNRAVREAFAGKVQLPAVAPGEEKLVRVASDNEGEEEDEVEEEELADAAKGEAGGSDEKGWESMDED